ncbi:MAG: glycosyltransferase [Planctomycetota bacterium]
MSHGSPTRPSVRALLLHRRIGDDAVHDQKVAGYFTHADALREQLGLRIDAADATTLDDARRAAEDAAARTDRDHSTYGLVLLQAHWLAPLDELIGLIGDLRRLHPDAKLALIDWADQTSSIHFPAAAHLDAFLKCQTLRPVARYQEDFAGGFVFTDFLVRELGYDLDGWSHGSPVPPDHAPKLVPAPGLGASPGYRRLQRLAALSPLPWSARPYLLNRRFGRTAPQAEADRPWSARYRDQVQDRLETWAARHRCTAAHRVHRARYLLELTLAKMTVSPFGWGEVCFRDYEAVACGSLLIKPSMDHLRTSPDIYRPDETYVPVRWDLADLDEKIAHYQSHPDEARRIVRNAGETLRDYHDRGGFVEDQRRVLRALGLIPASAADR